jgi:lipopolysaccharide transport system permease protein
MARVQASVSDVRFAAPADLAVAYPGAAPAGTRTVETQADIVDIEAASPRPADLQPSAGTRGRPVLELEPGPMSRGDWLRTMWDHRSVLMVLSRKDFQVRFKRARLGVLWAVAVPAVQAAVMIVVFSHFVHSRNGVPYGPFVLSGILGWTYFASTIGFSVGSIVDGATLTDKVWFPRALLPIVPCISGLVGLGISMVILLIFGPLLGGGLHLRILLIVPACILLIAFTTALSVVVAALQVYYRDVRFLVAAALTVWIYATPIMYQKSQVGGLGKWLDINPMTGIVAVFHLAIIGNHESWRPAVAVSVVVTAALIVIGVEAQRRYDRLFVDLL